jgi:septum formation protein
MSVNNAPKLVLASASPRRQELLQKAGVEFISIPCQTEETSWTNEKPKEFCLAAAKQKALNVADGLKKDTWVLGADTIVVIGNTILGKPSDPDDAKRMLMMLSGRSHNVYTGVVLVRAPNTITHQFVADTTVVFRQLDHTTIQRYIDTNEPYDKAGGYAIQGIGTSLVRSISGSYTNVVGLPLVEVLEILEESGAWSPIDQSSEPLDTKHPKTGGAYENHSY